MLDHFSYCFAYKFFWRIFEHILDEVKGEGVDYEPYAHLERLHSSIKVVKELPKKSKVLSCEFRSRDSI